jgi:RimJ/RimL family protein N-acetyltransferase
VRDELETPRLRLRRWRADDLDTLARWHVDPELMRHMGRLSFTREEMEADLERYERHWSEHGFGLWATEEKESGDLIGRVGLAYHRVWPSDPEVGWLIDRPWQARGLATEAGEACLRYGFDELGFERIVSICTAENVPSRRVMEKLGFRPWQRIHDPKVDLELLLHVRERSD